MIGVRTNSFNESFLNEDLDANSVLTELDKGLRSSKVGEQCESIVRFPKLFEKYPFPILINSSFLKLAEFFRTGSNLLRLWVLRVCQQSEKHLGKILNVDEFVKRIFVVIHSNDPVARAITLRTLGSVSCVIPEKEQVHHAIRRALDSHDTVEVEAAIHASVQFAAQSKTFAISMCSKVASMIESLQTPVNMKLQLIPVLRHMHHDATTAALVKKLCTDLLPKYPSENFVIVTLNSLSQLSYATLVDIPDQINLLITYLSDPRKKVRVQVLKSLLKLAEKSHLWPKGSVKNLISFAKMRSEAKNEQTLVLTVILTLTKCPVSCNYLLNEESKLVTELCVSVLVLDFHIASSLAIDILTSLVTYCHNEKIPPPPAYMEQIHLHLQSLVYGSLVDNEVKELSRYLKCGVRLSEYDSEFSESFVEFVGSLLTDDCGLGIQENILVCETFAALCSQYSKDKFIKKNVSVSESSEMMEVDEQENPFLSLLFKLLQRLITIIELDLDDTRKDCRFIETLTAVCLQSLLGYHIPNKVLEAFEKIANGTNRWTQFRIARSASRYGHHVVACKIYEKLSKHVSQEKYYFFLSALTQISKAECVLRYGYDYEELMKIYPQWTEKFDNKKSKMNLIQRLEKAIAYYWKALANLKATSSPACSLIFQTEFVKLRGQFLEALLNILIAKNTQYITPPPAIGQTLAQNSRDCLQKYGHITTQLRKCVKTMKSCEDGYSKLYKSVFDADPCTLENLEISRYLCSTLGNCLETICFLSPIEAPNIPTKGNYPETAFAMNMYLKIGKKIECLPQESGNSKSITDVHTEVIQDQIEMTLKSPICIPRYFFQALQNTSIKLSLNPQPRGCDAITVQTGHNLVIKIEGVIQNYTKIKKPFRTIDSVQLTLVSQLISQRQNEIKPANDTSTTNLTQTVKPYKDFLSGNFLVSLNNVSYNGQSLVYGGQWQVNLEASIIDENGVVWNSGLKSSLIVKVPDENKQGFARRF